ncbi:hypothetical protein GUJ93_ZPchr0061g33655 [Zizania palustris]|uniref:Uncharacterized protein n=1 Tax=Zizania palustris TaxID=103762 RepID=A0A8J5RTC8_ZIZPA|nr:hypothetical protein GUJ93_ZPchr0061g33655 [Zizania palustris]
MSDCENNNIFKCPHFLSFCCVPDDAFSSSSPPAACPSRSGSSGPGRLTPLPLSPRSPSPRHLSDGGSSRTPPSSAARDGEPQVQVQAQRKPRSGESRRWRSLRRRLNPSRLRRADRTPPPPPPAFMGNVVDTVKRLSGNNSDATMRCSYLPNGTPRLDKCTCGDNDSSVMEESASAINGGINGGNNSDATMRCSYLPNGTPRLDKCTCGDDGNSVREESASAINGGINGHGTFYKEVDNEELHLAADNTSKSEDLGDINCTGSPEKRFCSNHKATEDLENAPAMDTHMSKRSRLHRISPSYSLFDHEVCDKLIDGACNLGRKSTPEASVHNEMAPNEVTPPYALRGCESTPTASFKRRVNRKRTNHEASHQTTALNENTGALVPSDAKCLEMVIQSPLTRTKTKALSIATRPTPESLKLRSSRSGRLIVPRLDPGCQNIIYDMDGSIRGVTNLELPCMLQGSSNSGPCLEPLLRGGKGLDIHPHDPIDCCHSDRTYNETPAPLGYVRLGGD